MILDTRLSWFTNLLYCIDSQLWKNIELVMMSLVTLTYEWDSKMVIYSLKIGSLLIKAGNNRYSQDRYYDILWNWDSASSNYVS